MLSRLQTLISSTSLLIAMTSFNLAQTIPAHPDTLGLTNSSYTVREATMKSWTEWISKNPDTCLNVLKVNYINHREDPEIRVRLTYLIEQIMMRDLKKVRLGISYKEKSVTLENGTRIQAMTVTKVKVNSACHKAGILPKDIIIGFNLDSTKLKTKPLPVKSQLTNIKINTPVKIYAIREQQQIIFNTTFTTYLPSKESDQEKRQIEFKNVISQLDLQTP